MSLPNREMLAKSWLDGVEKHFEAQVIRLTPDVDNVLANSVGIDDHQRLDNALASLFEQRAAQEDALETVRQYRKSREV